MVAGNWVLQNLSVLPAAVATPLMQYPGQFLHGCLSADIFIGKGSAAREGHSHNWSSGFSLLEKAPDLRARAYALGYLSHLAADTVAHNVYVPENLHTAPGAGRMAHVYLEIQADRLLSWDSTDAVGVFYESGSKEAARMLRSAMGQKAFNFWLKKHVFERSISIGGSAVWRNSMRLLDSIFPAGKREALVDEMLTVSTRAIFSLLTQPETSPVLGLDPIGADALALAGTRTGKRKLLLRSIPLRLLTGGYGRNTPFMPGAGYGIDIALPEALACLPVFCTSTAFCPQPTTTTMSEADETDKV